MKLFKQSLLVAALLTAGLNSEAKPGWPANYQGVMLQGFYWDSFDDTAWTNLESQADELSKYFKLIWVPNSAKPASNPGMGYDPVYWFTNHNTKFGTEAQLRSMIKTFKDKGTGIIEDVVINHRSGVSNWTNFPAEKWNGTTWKIGADGICCTDEVKDAAGQEKPTGAADTGEDFNGSRDLDHTNANVQNNCKNYCKFLLEDMGYAGFRYDMVKGYAGKYTKIYNDYSQPDYSVGEYWDGSYDAVAAWIEATGKTSAAFDFPCKYQINKAFATNDMTQLVWKANGTTDQPAGMIHFGYPQYSVTFVDNHDTYRDGSKFTGNVVAANAFILFSPGTPCVFLPHWKAYKAELKKLIDLRNAVGIHNMSAVKVLKSTSNCYMAEITGTKGKAVVKIGSSMDSPSGYTNADIKASGKDYCVWSKVEGGGGGDDPDPQPDVPAKLYVLGNLEGAAGWGTTPGTGMAMTKDGSKFTAKGVKFVLAGATETKCFFNLTDYVGTDWDDLNMGANRYGAATEGETITLGSASTITPYLNGVDASGCLSWTVAPGTYDITADFATMKITLVNAGDDPGPQPQPDAITIIGDYNMAYSGDKENVYYWGGSSKPEWPGVKMATATGSDGKTYKVFKVTEGTTNVIFNTNGDSNKTADLKYSGEYIMTDNGPSTIKVIFKDGDDPIPHPDVPATLGVLSTPWGGGTANEVLVTPMAVNSNNTIWEIKSYTVGAVTPAPGSTVTSNDGYVQFAVNLEATTWDELNTEDRYGAAVEGTALEFSGRNATATMKCFTNSAALDADKAGACNAFKVAPGTYDFSVVFSADGVITLNATNVSSGIENIGENVDDESAAEYFNLQGVKVSNPSNGIYIRRANGHVSKVLVK